MRLYDAATGSAVGNPISVTLQPGDWTQWSGVFETAGVPAGTTAAYAVVTRLGGDDTWLAYGVLNDAKTSDGSVLRMIPVDGVLIGRERSSRGASTSMGTARLLGRSGSRRSAR